MRTSASLSGALMLTLVSATWVGPTWANAPKKPINPHCLDPLEVPLIPTGDAADERVRLSADKNTMFKDADGFQVMDLSGQVQAISGEQAIETDAGHYTKRDQNFTVKGNLVYQTPDMQILGSGGQFNLGTHLGHIDSGKFRFFESTSHGTAHLAELEPDRIIVLHQGNYTTCPKRQPDWTLRFSRLTLDRNDGAGTGRNVWLSFMGVPFLYTPFIRFPIDDRRRTGLLTPSYRYSSENGGELAIPLYVNLAPNLDLTLQPINMTGRGFLIGGDFRYMIPHGSGSLTLDYLPDDQIRRKERHQIEWSHHSQLNPNLQADIDFHRVSDNHFLEELGDSLSTASLTHLSQRAALHFSGSQVGGICPGPDLPNSRPQHSRIGASVSGVATAHDSESRTAQGRPTQSFDLRPIRQLPWPKPYQRGTSKIETKSQSSFAIDSRSARQRADLGPYPILVGRSVQCQRRDAGPDSTHAIS